MTVREGKPAFVKVDRTKPGHEDQRKIGIQSGDAGRQFGPGHVRHHHIGDHKVNGFVRSLKKRPRLLPVPGFDDTVASFAHGSSHKLEHRHLVVYRENGRHQPTRLAVTGDPYAVRLISPWISFSGVTGERPAGWRGSREPLFHVRSSYTHEEFFYVSDMGRDLHAVQPPSFQQLPPVPGGGGRF